MIIRAVDFIALYENKNFHLQYKVHAQHFLVADTLENILLIKLRQRGIDKHTGTKCFILELHTHKALEANFEDS